MKTSLSLNSIIALVICFGFPIVRAEEEIGPPLQLFHLGESYSPPYYTTVYSQPTNPKEGQLKIGANYTLWIPDGLKKVRGVIIHQHGCGSPAAAASITAAHDLHWQELARRTNCALMGVSYHLPENTHCRAWTFPRAGSGIALFDALQDLATLSGHPEIASAPLCLWGHSGGGSWSSRMQRDYPERIAAIWFQSGSAYSKDDFDSSTLSDAALQIPIMACPGVKEIDHERFAPAWHGSLAMFKDFRARGSPIGFAPDPNSSHETADSRYLAIPFLEACLNMRLPDRMGEPLMRIDPNKGWFAPLLSKEMPLPSHKFKGNKLEAVWLPNEHVARAWHDFVNTGTVADKTPPLTPFNILVDQSTGVVTWNASVDFESGIQAFVIERDGEYIGQVPKDPKNRYGRALFQGLSYGDTPERLLKFQFVDTDANFTGPHKYRVIAVNGAGLRSK